MRALTLSPPDVSVNVFTCRYDYQYGKAVKRKKSCTFLSEYKVSITDKAEFVTISGVFEAVVL